MLIHSSLKIIFLNHIKFIYFLIVYHINHYHDLTFQAQTTILTLNLYHEFV